MASPRGRRPRADAQDQAPERVTMLRAGGLPRRRGEQALRMAGVAKAIGDPIRRQLIDVLRKHAGQDLRVRADPAVRVPDAQEGRRPSRPGERSASPRLVQHPGLSMAAKIRTLRRERQVAPRDRRGPEQRGVSLRPTVRTDGRPRWCARPTRPGLAVSPTRPLAATAPSESCTSRSRRRPGLPSALPWMRVSGQSRIPRSGSLLNAVAAAGPPAATRSSTTAYATREPVPIALATDRECAVAASPAA